MTNWLNVAWSPIAAMAILFLPLRAGVAPSTLVNATGIDRVDRSGATDVVVYLDSPVSYNSHRLSNPDRAFFDLMDTRLNIAPAGRLIAVGEGLIDNIRIAQHSRSVTRVVLQLRAPSSQTVTMLSDPPRLVIEVKPSSESQAASAAVGGRNPPVLATPIVEPVTAESAKRVLHIPRVSRAPKLQEFLEGRPREQEARVSDFRQREPDDGLPVTQSTTAYLSYDDENIYAVFVCKEAAGWARGRMTKREDIDSDDQVTLYLDTFGDRHRAYVFATNPLGIQRDSIFTEGQGDDPNFDTLWHSEGRLTPDGFIVWMAIPFKSLRYSRTSRQTWGIAFGRTAVRSNDKSFWPFITLKKQGFVDQFATLEGLDNISAGRNLQFIPYTSFTHARLLDPARPAFLTQRDYRGGLDSKVVLRDSLSLDVTINPDFSQVESDDPQVTLNQRYEVYFPEKRPFFVENAGFFQTPINLFFSRRIIDPEFGARLAGKLGHWTIGALAIDDRAPGQQLNSFDPLRGDRAVIGVGRVQRDFGGQSNIGAFVSSREFGSTSNTVASVDTRLKLNANWTYTGQAVETITREAGGPQETGTSYFSELTHNGRHFSTDVKYIDRSPNFQTDLGFIQRVNIRQVDQSSGYFFRPAASRIVTYGPSVGGGATWDHSGRLTDWYGGAQFAMYFKGPIGFEVSEFKYYTLYLNRALRTSRTDSSFFVNRWKRLNLSATLGHGTNVNYNPADGLNPFVAGATDASLSLSWRPTSRFRMDNKYYFSHLGGLKGGAPEGFDRSATVFNNHLFRSKMNYQFSRALSVRTIVDYNGILPNSSLIFQDKYKRVTGDFLLTYLLNPGTALFIGYTNRYENLALAYNGRYTVVPTTGLSNSTARQVFVKLNYLFRF